MHGLIMVVFLDDFGVDREKKSLVVILLMYVQYDGVCHIFMI